MDPNAEINRLRDLMPATGRMKTRLMLNDSQPNLIRAEVPRPWNQTHPVTLNLGLWQQLTEPQRDLLFLRTVCWVTAVNLLRPDWYQGLAVTGALGTVFELSQGDAVGVLTAAGLATLAGVQLWRTSRGVRVETAADEKAVEVAQRRGYTATEAAQALLTAIEMVPRIEEHGVLSAIDLIRCQNLRAVAGFSPAPLPERYLQQ
ncbi:MAG: DUF3318 domain-containing protein [Cyanobacteria bacterium Co-bin13]|nr:DUF3318 domain-containing protein [Cyanobacteria bacterium Co-bin13]